MGFFEKGAVRIHFEEAGSGFPLLVIPGGGLNSTISGLTSSSSPFNPMEVFKSEYHCIASDLRNAAGGRSTGPLEAGRPWDALVFIGFCLVVNVSMALTNLIADLVVFSLGSLVLLVRLNIVSLQERWQRYNIVPSGEMDWRSRDGGHGH